MNQTESRSAVFQTRWGYVPYSYESYLKLKELNKIFQVAVKRASQWKRWVRKAPHNRIERIKIRNEKGQVIGYRTGKPLPEPVICELFSRKLVDLDRNPIGGRWPMYLWGKFIVTDYAIEQEYRKSHRPVELQENVEPAQLTESQIDDLLLKAREWIN